MRLPLIALAFLTMVMSASADPLPPLGGMMKAPEVWQAYKEAFITPGGRVIDNANGDVSHSEGQGYGMLLAVAADDRPEFEKLWNWTRAQLMLRDDGLAAWRWDPGKTPHVSDRNNATDGDILLAWALAEAGERWSVPAYQTASLAIASAVASHLVADSVFGPVLLPGAAGFTGKDKPDGPVLNLSYWVFPAISRLAVLQPDHQWKVLFHSGMDLLQASRFGPARLPSDWISIASPDPAPAKGFAPTFGYDAIRIPLYLAWAGATRKGGLAPFARLWQDAAAPPQKIDVLTGDAVEVMGDSGYRAIAALVACARDGTKLPSDVLATTVDRYYPTTLRLLVLVAARQRYPQCL